MNNMDFLDLDHQRLTLTRFLDSFSERKRQKAYLALVRAERAHEGQMRDSDVPYVIHPIRATITLAGELMIQDIDMICACLLHDVVEDGGVSLASIESEFSRETARLIEGVTRHRPDNETEEDKIKRKAEKFHEIAQKDEKIRIIKLCDILDNMRSMKYIDEAHENFKKIPRWKKELKEFVLPIAQNTNEQLYNLLAPFGE